MQIPKVEIAKDPAKLKQQIAALEYQIPLDTSELDRQIHTQALEDLRAAERGFKVGKGIGMVYTPNAPEVPPAMENTNTLKTINQMRRDYGLEPIENGDVVLCKTNAELLEDHIKDVTSEIIEAGLNPEKGIGRELIKQTRELIYQHYEIQKLKKELEAIKNWQSKLSTANRIMD